MSTTSLFTRRSVLTGMACLAAVIAIGLPDLSLAADNPQAIMEKIYASYKDNGTPAKADYTAELATLLDDFEKHPGFDFFIDGQDYDKVSAEVVLAAENDRTALVKVKATNFGKVRELEVDFVKDAGTWKIANVRYPGAEGFDLRSSVGLPAL
ncbi:hypothetical protein [Pararhizobium sp.]|uniref:hypothetical protein n=1 Tax=Pararhizobium sp. TaxID=1977563 RepID=UPI00271DDD59|nr:hypothetical protein [Pararhizobium sp.]MDO9415404.1 DUF3828 domain-containing protein [Pararhizobium sp.]